MHVERTQPQEAAVELVKRYGGEVEECHVVEEDMHFELPVSLRVLREGERQRRRPRVPRPASWGRRPDPRRGPRDRSGWVRPPTSRPRPALREVHCRAGGAGSRVLRRLSRMRRANCHNASAGESEGQPAAVASGMLDWTHRQPDLHFDLHSQTVLEAVANAERSAARRSASLERSTAATGPPGGSVGRTVGHRSRRRVPSAHP